MLVLLIRHWQTIAAFAAGALVGGVLMLGWTMTVTVPNAREQGRELERAAALQRSMEIIEQRSETNAQVDTLDSAGICAALGGEWMPDGEPKCQ